MKNPPVTPRVPSPQNAQELLELFFLDMRCALLETAAALDRIERAEGAAEALRDPRLQQISQACDILKDGTGNRAEQFLRLFSE